MNEAAEDIKNLVARVWQLTEENERLKRDAGLRVSNEYEDRFSGDASVQNLTGSGDRRRRRGGQTDVTLRDGQHEDVFDMHSRRGGPANMKHVRLQRAAHSVVADP